MNNFSTKDYINTIEALTKMKIRPLHKTSEGHWRSDCGQWLLAKKSVNGEKGWWVYQRMIDNKFHTDTPYFYYPHNTREELIISMEKHKAIHSYKNPF